MNAKNKELRRGLMGLVLFVAILFLLGIYVYKPEPDCIQGEAVASELRISGKVPGRIAQYLVEEGSRVKAGDTLVFLESPELEAKLMQAHAARQAAMAQQKKANNGAREELIATAYEMWQKALVGVDISKKSLDRVQHMFEKGVVTAQKRDEVEAQYKAALATANAAKAQYDMATNGAEGTDKEAAMALVDRASGAVMEVESYLTETTLVSPIDGEVSEIFPKVGELVGTGAPIMNVLDGSNVWFAFHIREDRLSDFRLGKKIDVRIPALNNQTVSLEVTFIKALASYATVKATKTNGQFDARTFEVRAKPLQPIDDVRPGMSALLIP